MATQPKQPNPPKPLSRRTVSRAVKARPALRDNLSRVTNNFFVAGGSEPPKVEARVILVERVIDGSRSLNYEVRIELEGVRLGERSTPPPLQARLVKESIPREQLHQYESLLKGFVPEHLAIDPQPRRLLKPFKRIPDWLDRKTRYNTTVFLPDDRHVFQDTSYPWSAFGRCETNFGPFSGVMIGPRHLLTCNHGIDWTPPPGFDADWLTFTPAYFDGGAPPFGSTYATHVYAVQKDNNNGVSDGDEGQFDYAVVVLNDRIGDLTGWIGARSYTDAWDGLTVWWHIGYPADIASQQRPVYQSWFAMNGDDKQDDAHQIIRHQADVFPGQSGGPIFGFWDDGFPYAVATQSWQDGVTNGASGGSNLIDLAIRALSEHP